MRILVTGARGMLGVDACRVLLAAGHDVVATSHSDHPDCHTLDIADGGAVRAMLSDAHPDVVLQCAAYTNVDGCERDEAHAVRANADGARNVAAAADSIGAAMVYISTDYVFDGALGRPYVETDPPHPLNAYGRSKLAGEQAVLAECRRGLVARTSWLYGENGKNFVFTMLRGARERGELHVVADQHGTPTYTADLAQALVPLIERGATGIYHVTNQGETSWHGFASAIVAAAGADIPVHPMTSEETAQRFGTPTVRPTYSVLRNQALENDGGPLLRPWQDALDDFLGKVGFGV